MSGSDTMRTAFEKACERLGIDCDGIIDHRATYDNVEGVTCSYVGALKRIWWRPWRKRMKWILYSTVDAPLGSRANVIGHNPDGKYFEGNIYWAEFRNGIDGDFID